MDNRIIFRVLPSTTIKGWWDIRISNAESVIVVKFKKDACLVARLLAKQKHDEGMNAQLVLHNRQGKISREYTYGNDPKKYKG